MNLLKLTLVALLIQNLASTDRAFVVSIGERQLFLDDEGIAKIEGLQRTMHQPKKRGAVIKPDQPWESTLQTRCAPVWDDQAKRFKIWMITSTPVDGVAGATYAESLDGVKWTKPILRQWKFQGSLENNFVAIAPDSTWPSNAMENVVYDPDDDDPKRRFKGFLGALSRQPIVSPDGIHWKKLDVPELPSNDESNLSFDRPSRTFIATFKQAGPFGRAHGIWTSPDFQKWTNTGVLFHADEEDQKLAKLRIKARLADSRLRQPVFHTPASDKADIYNVGIFKYEGLYLALPAVFYTTSVAPDNDGFHEIQLAVSRNLTTWRRLGDRQAFIGPSEVSQDTFDHMQLLPPSAPVIRDEELWFYYTGIKYRVAPTNPDRDNGAICLAVLRRDGFLSLDASNKPGTMTTQPFPWTGSRLFANVQTKEHGELYAEVLDQTGTVVATSLPLTSDLPRGELRWTQGSLAPRNEQIVRLRFTLRNASFYSYWIER